jgi:hypothetical protein
MTLTAWITEAGCDCLQSGDGPVRVMPHECEETGFTVALVAAPDLAAMEADIALLRKTEQRLRAQLESAHVLIAGLDRRAIAHGKERAELAAKAADVAGERAANAALTAELEQRQRPLTEYEVDRLWLQRLDLHDGELMPQLRDFARAVETAHGIGAA